MNQQEELNFEIFKQTAGEQNMDVCGTGLAREFVPEYMRGDICERPERNSSPNSWNNDDGALNLPGESTIYDSFTYSDETISNTDTE